MVSDASTNRKVRLAKVLSIAVILACSISIYGTMCSGRPKFDKRPILEAGQMIGEETLKLIGRKGNVVVVTMDNRYGKLQVNEFRRTIEKQPGAEMTAVEYVTNDQLAKGAMGSALSSETFLKLIQKFSDVSAIVSLVGPPVLTDQEISRLDTKIPKVVVFAPLGFGIRKLLEEQVVQVAIVPRVTPLMASTLPGTATTAAPPQAGERYYEVVTPQTIQTRPVFEPPVPIPRSK